MTTITLSKLTDLKTTIFSKRPQGKSTQSEVRAGLQQKLPQSTYLRIGDEDPLIVEDHVDVTKHGMHTWLQLHMIQGRGNTAIAMLRRSHISPAAFIKASLERMRYDYLGPIEHFDKCYLTSLFQTDETWSDCGYREGVERYELSTQCRESFEKFSGIFKKCGGYGDISSMMDPTGEQFLLMGIYLNAKFAEFVNKGNLAKYEHPCEEPSHNGCDICDPPDTYEGSPVYHGLKETFYLY